jgi:hypothetical protein
VLAFSDVGWTAIAGLGAALIVAAGAALTSRVQWRRERAERRREERKEAYLDYIRVVNESAHRLGNLGENPYGEPATDRVASAYFLDSEVTPRLRAIQLLVPSGSRVERTADNLLEALKVFRETMTTTDEPPAYRSEEYDDDYQLVLDARDNFISAANADLGSAD